MKRKRISLLLASLMLAGVLTACADGVQNTPQSTAQTTAAQTTAADAKTETKSEAAPQNANLRFMWWGGETRHKATVEALDLYMERNPGVKVEAEYSGWSGYFDKLLTQLAGNTAPDLVQISYTNVGEYVLRNQLMALNPHIESGILHTDKLNAELLQVYNIDGSYYAIPSGIMTQFLYYNKDIFAKYDIPAPQQGITLNEYYDLGRRITAAARAAGDEEVWGLSSSGGAMDVLFQKYMIDFGGQLWTDDLTRAAFHSEEGLEALEFALLPGTEGFAPPPEMAASVPQGLDTFSGGYAAMSVGNSTAAAGYASVVEFDMGMILEPFGNNHKAIWYQSGPVYVMTSQSKAPEASAALLDFLVNDGDAGNILGFERGVPINDDIRNALADQVSALEQAQLALINEVAQYTGDGVPMPFPAGYLEIHTEFGRLLEACTYGQMTAKDMLVSLEEFSNKTIAKFAQ